MEGRPHPCAPYWGLLCGLLLLACGLTHTVLGDEVRMCYFDIKKTPNYSYRLNNVDTSLCSHIVFHMTTITNNMLSIEDKYLFEKRDRGKLRTLASLSWSNPGLKILLGIDITKANLEGITVINQTAVNIAQYFNGYRPKLHGVSLHHIENGITRLIEMSKFTQLCQALKHRVGTDKRRAIMALLADSDTTGYEIRKLSGIMDFIILKTFRQENECRKLKKADVVAPLYNITERDFSVNGSAKAWVHGKVDKTKLVIGLVSHGCNRSLKYSHESSGNVAKLGAALRKDLHKPTTISFSEICHKYGEQATAPVRRPVPLGEDPLGGEPYFNSNSGWIGYEDQDSLTAKREWIRSEQFAGWMMWDMHQDDFTGVCGLGPYPLLNALNKEKVTSTKEAPTEETTTTSTVKDRWKSATVTSTKRPTTTSILPSTTLSTPSTPPTSATPTTSPTTTSMTTPTTTSTTTPTTSKTPPTTKSTTTPTTTSTTPPTTTSTTPPTTTSTTLPTTSTTPTSTTTPTTKSTTLPTSTTPTTTSTIPPTTTSTTTPTSTPSPTTSTTIPTTTLKTSTKPPTTTSTTPPTTTTTTPPTTTSTTPPTTSTRPPTTTSKKPPTTTSTRPPTEIPATPVTCSEDGEYIADSSDCRKFYQCNSHLEPIVKFCPAGLHFNAASNICDWPMAAKCVLSP